MANTHHKDEVTKQSRLLIRNIGLMLSGDLENPILDADVILAIDGKITSIGKQKDIDGEGATLVIDAKGTTADSRPDRQPRTSSRGRLDPAPEPDWLD